MVTTDNLKLYVGYINAIITMDKDEKLAIEIANK